MRFLADESVERAVVEFLRSAGHDVRYVAEDAAGIEDSEVLATANVEKRILLTNDKDFGELVFLGSSATAGIVLIRLGREDTAAKVEAIRKLLAAHSDNLWEHFTVLGRKRVRRRPLRPQRR